MNPQGGTSCWPAVLTSGGERWVRAPSRPIRRSPLTAHVTPRAFLWISRGSHLLMNYDRTASGKKSPAIKVTMCLGVFPGLEGVSPILLLLMFSVNYCPPILLHCQCLPQWRWRTMGVEGSRWNWFYLLRPSFDRIFSAHTETSRQESWYSNYPVAWHLQTNLQKISPWKVSRSTASTVIVKLPLENYRVLLSPNEYPLFLFWKK